MAIIYTYGFDDNVQDKDAWVGTNSGNRKTKQFSALSVANYMNRYGRISIGGQMSYKLVASSPGLGEMSVIGGGDGTNFADIEFLNISTNDLSGAQVVEFLDYLTSTGVLISRQNEPSVFGHYTVVAYTATIDPNVYKLELGILGSNGVVNTNMYYDLSPLNLAGGSGSGVNTIDTSEGSFITLTPTTPTAGNVLITADLSATGTPDATTFLRGDNTWAAAGEVDGNGTTNYVSKWADPSTLTDSVIYDDGTNVGIGINNPAVELHVGGFARLNGGLQLNTANAQIYQIQNSDLRFGTNNTERMRITSTGNVGIGTTNPGAKLEISETGTIGAALYIDTARYGIVVIGDGTSNSQYLLNLQGNGGSTNAMAVQSSGNVGIGTTSPGYKLEVSGNTALSLGADRYLRIGSSTNYWWDLQSVSNDFTLKEAGSNIRLIVKAGGNVGIGTSSPQVKLETRGTASNTISSTTAVSKIVGNVGTGSVGLYSGSLAGSPNYGTWIQSMRETDNLAFQLLLNPNGGNVGIGTTSPSRLLDVDGIQGWSEGTNVEKAYLSPTSTGVDFNLSGDNGAIRFDSRAGSNSYINTGNVGIGTTSPQRELHIHATNYTDIQLTNDTTGAAVSNGSTISATFNDLYINNKESGNLMLFTNNSERVRVTSSGNVGIGTTSPATKLHVSGGGGVSTPVLFTLGSNDDGTGANAAEIRLLDNGTTKWQVGKTSLNDFWVYDNTAGRSVITARDNGNLLLMQTSGNVGIGTSGPTQELHVDGNARVTGAFYDSNNSAGAVGQVLTSTSTSTEWTDPGSITQVPVPITAFAGGSLALAATVNFVYFSWLGGSGTYTLNLPSAVTYPYKVIRFVTDGGTSASNKIHIQGSLGQTVDGGTFYALDKAYNGVQVWSDGSEWIVIQAKAT